MVVSGHAGDQYDPRLFRQAYEAYGIVAASAPQRQRAKPVPTRGVDRMLRPAVGISQRVEDEGESRRDTSTREGRDSHRGWAHSTARPRAGARGRNCRAGL